MCSWRFTGREITHVMQWAAVTTHFEETRVPAHPPGDDHHHDYVDDDGDDDNGHDYDDDD